MQFHQVELEGAYIIKLNKKRDNRGYFARNFCVRTFEENGIDFKISQCNYSYNIKKGTLRGLHYQTPPYEEGKIVACVQGRIYDVIVDIRKKSKTYGKWFAKELSSETLEMIYIPTGFAHGFVTLEDNTFILYYMSQEYNSEYAHGIRWNDKTLKIKWPIQKPIISKRDASLNKFANYK